MKKIILLLIVVFIMSLLVVFVIPKKKDSDVTKLKNRDNYTIINSDSIIFKDIITSKTLVVFSASWCEFCVNEKDDLNKFIASNPDARIVIVSHDYNYSTIENFLKQNNLNWYVILDTNKTIRETIHPNSSGIPSAYILNENLDIISYKKSTMNFDDFTRFYNSTEKIYEE